MDGHEFKCGANDRRSDFTSESEQNCKDDVETADDEIISAVIRSLDSIPDPCCVLSGKDLSIMDLGLINEIKRHGSEISVYITLTDTMCEFSYKIYADIEAIAREIPGVSKVSVIAEPIPVWSTDRLSDKAIKMIKDDAGAFFRNWDLQNS